MCGLMQWSGLWRYPTIGYNAEGILYVNHHLTGRAEANKIDCDNSNSVYTNVLYRISIDPDKIKILQSQCLSWYYSDIESYGSNENISVYSNSQLDCPCTWLQADRDIRFTVYLQKDDSLCFIDRFTNDRGGGQLCCYSYIPQFYGAIVTRGASSGGLLRFHPGWEWTTNYFKYIEYDRDPQEECCFPGVGYCHLYHLRRPPKTCARYNVERRGKCSFSLSYNIYVLMYIQQTGYMVE